MRIYVKPHQHKADAIIQALEHGGHKLARRSVDVALFDVVNGYRGEGFLAKAQILWNEGATIVLYPHAATIPWWYDGVWELDPRIAGILVTTEAHQKIVERFVPQDVMVRPIGWTLCEQRSFKSIDLIQRILFMPIHPPKGGMLRKEAREANRQTMVALSALADRYEIIVRFIGDLDRQGIWYHPGITYLKALPDGGLDEIDAADLVIAEGTALHLAVARGKPTIGINQHEAPRSNFGDLGGKHWSEYADVLSYPIDQSDGPLEDLFLLANSSEQENWRKENVGESMEIEKLEYLLSLIRDYDLRVLGRKSSNLPNGILANCEVETK